MNIGEIACSLGINRNTTARYLDILYHSKQVEMRQQGMAKKYYLSDTIPLSSILNYSSDFIIILDKDLRILYVNDNLLQFEQKSRESLLGIRINSVRLSITDDPEIAGALESSPSKKVCRTTIRRNIAGNERFFSVTIAHIFLAPLKTAISVIAEDITERERYATALKENEERFRRIFEHAAVGTLETTVDGTCTGVNKAMAAFTGFSPEEMLGKTLAEFIHPDDVYLVEKSLEKYVVRESKVLSFEARVVTRSGRNAFGWFSISPLADIRGTVFRLVCQVHDITQRKEAELALMNSEERFRQFIEHFPGIVFVKDHELRMTYASRSIERIFNRPMKEILYRRNDELYPPDQAGQVSREESSVLVMQEGDFLHKEEIFELDGSPHHFATYKFPLMQATGNPCIGGLSLDITDVKRLQFALIRSEENFRLLAEQSSDIIARVSTNGVFLYVSPSVITITGYYPLELIGRSVLDFIHPDEKDTIKNIYTMLLTGLKKTTILTRINHKSGEYVWLESHISLITRQGGGGPSEIYLVLRDISDRISQESTSPRNNEL